MGETIDLKRYVDFSKEFCKLNPQLDNPYDEDMTYSSESLTFLTDNLQEVIDLITYSYFIFNAELDRRNSSGAEDTFFDAIVREKEESIH